jgi:hypothetical protein
VFGVGVWTVAAKHEYVVLLTNATYEVAAWVLILAGCMVFVVTAIGCIGVLQDNRFFILLVRQLDEYCGFGLGNTFSPFHVRSRG